MPAKREIRRRARVIPAEKHKHTNEKTTSTGGGAVPYRNPFVAPRGPHGCNSSIQARRDLMIWCRAEQSFFIGPPLRRSSPHAENMPLGPRVTDAGQGMARAARDLFVRYCSQQRQLI